MFILSYLWQRQSIQEYRGENNGIRIDRWTFLSIALPCNHILSNIEMSFLFGSHTILFLIQISHFILVEHRSRNITYPYNSTCRNK